MLANQWNEWAWWWQNNLDKVAKTLARESDINKDIVIKNIDKTHPISKIDEKDLQHTIVKFTTK